MDSRWHQAIQIKTLQYTTIKIYIKYIKIVKNIKTIAHTELHTVVQAPQRDLSPVPGKAVSQSTKRSKHTPPLHVAPAGHGGGYMYKYIYIL